MNRLAPLLLTLGAAVCSLLLLAGGSPAVLLVPWIAAGAFALAWWAPPRWTALLLLAGAIGLESPQDFPAEGLWMSPFHAAGRFFFEHLEEIAGFGGPVSPAELLATLCAAALLYRSFHGEAAEGARVLRAFRWPLFGFAVALGVALLWGLARGGSVTGAYWQIRQLMLVVPLAALFCLALRGAPDHAAVMRVVVAAACLKACSAVYTAKWVLAPANLTPEYVTTHADTVVFVAALAALIARGLELRRWTGLLLAGPLIFAGMVVNDRRLAWVALAAVLAAFAGLLPRRHLALLVRRSALAVPVVLSLLAAGVLPYARMVSTVESMLTHEDSSTRFRDVENLNLVHTLSLSPVLGHGFGHGYEERIKGDDMSDIFPMYRYLAHNAVLGLHASTGVLGFIALWGLLIAGVHQAAHAYRRGARPGLRARALFAIGCVATFAVQVFGDMGTQEWTGCVLLAAAVAIAAQLAAEVEEATMTEAT